MADRIYDNSQTGTNSANLGQDISASKNKGSSEYSSLQDFLIRNNPTIIERYTSGSHIFELGDKASKFYFVTKGFVRILRPSSEGGKLSTVDVLGKGDFFGEALNCHNRFYSCGCQAIDDVELRVIPCQTLRNTLLNNPIGLDLYLAQSDKYKDNLFGQIADLKVRTTTERLALFLIDTFNQQTCIPKISLPYDKQIIAEKLGMTPETLSRTFAKLKNYGVSSISGCEIVIDDINQLKELCRTGKGAI